MGCISSKSVGRSMSIHDRFNQGFHALTIGEDLHMTTSTSRQRDRIITLIKIASGKNLTSFRNVGCDDDAIGNSCTKTKNQASETTELQERSNLGHKETAASETDDQTTVQGSPTSRSFHTLEEFEELMEKVKLFEARIVESDSLETRRLSDDGPAGWKRKAMSEQLESLMLPISAKAELSSVGSLKEWINAGDDIDIYSPETPKFGSYANERREFGMFSPEIVAALEECMRQMDVEEASIVKQMEESYTC